MSKSLSSFLEFQKHHPWDINYFIYKIHIFNGMIVIINLLSLLMINFEEGRGFRKFISPDEYLLFIVFECSIIFVFETTLHDGFKIRIFSIIYYYWWNFSENFDLFLELFLTSFFHYFLFLSRIFMEAENYYNVIYVSFKWSFILILLKGHHSKVMEDKMENFIILLVSVY